MSIKNSFQKLLLAPYYTTLKKNSKLISIILFTVVAIIVIGLGYYYMYKKPLEEKANNAITTIEYIFGSDTSTLSMRYVLDGQPGNFKGALQIAKDYGDTDAGQLARFYAGYALLRLSKADSSILYLEKCNIKEINLRAKAKSILADAYANKGNYAKAAKLYKNSAEANSTDLVNTPEYYLRAGILFELSKNNAEAKKAYQKIIDLFPNFTENPYSGNTFISEAKKRLARLD
ncbi:MAG: tetratricopeptide repeat protein [Chitinophagaceae bacterium]